VKLVSATSRLLSPPDVVASELIFTVSTLRTEAVVAAAISVLAVRTSTSLSVTDGSVIKSVAWKVFSEAVAETTPM